MAGDLQHAARQRPDLVVRDQQLHAGQDAHAVRPALLEFRHHADAGEAASVLSAQMLPRECAGDGQDDAGRRRSSTSPRSSMPIYLQSAKEDHIAPANSVFKATKSVRRAGAFHHGRLGPYRRRDQSARRQEIPILDQRHAGRDDRSMARRRRSNIPAPGGRIGTMAGDRCRARKFPRASRATASSKCWATRRANMCG